MESIPEGELSKKTRDAIIAELNNLRQAFLKAHPKKTMCDLYTWDAEKAVDPQIVEGFKNIEDLVARDTESQKDPVTDGARFSRPCTPCMPFLAVLKKKHTPVPPEEMDEHIANVGNDTLEELFKMQKTLANKSKWEAISNAKKNGIFARPGDISACLGSGSPSEERGKDPGNDLKCVDGRCQPHLHTFCSTAEDGGCSVMSD